MGELLQQTPEFFRKKTMKNTQRVRQSILDRGRDFSGRKEMKVGNTACSDDPPIRAWTGSRVLRSAVADTAPKQGYSRGLDDCSSKRKAS